MADSIIAARDRIEIVGATDRGLRARQNRLAALGVPMICPPRFLVMLIEDDGGQAVLWDGTSYEQAIIEAERCSANWAVPVMDRVV
ncbi:hypothetical protein [Paracoccus denitrificans]|jgi:hypothetical protein|uniref:Uncharacterized protein n=1 Tax=Paracoccus denitrificans (strain Pd 1222) TaxID=318586 RepID=A1B5D3_PARDP|nr:hypothetical protein [Paracoccus denitrificans]ABL70727.1 hypothetical protein Pden_2640 [Paracoccus denitrificans PD1222]MBB4628895.1 hypothetical protein [Paracoccus denitrificans]MCU7429982.1 hypothetical protein [Paracoccus denitrificans]UPV94963.1 hypothetical protein M0K93_14190 [Paracoccus denitrificans]WQO32983.1 hypothetical protein U0005_11730 [Paracoccus denitrificans]